MTAALFVGAIGSEMLYLARSQMRLVSIFPLFMISNLNPEDPKDVMMIFRYALGVTPAAMLGRGLQVAAGDATKGAVKEYIGKSTLKALQYCACRLGFRILQKTILKYAVPVASAAVGSSYNYVTTKSVGMYCQSASKK